MQILWKAKKSWSFLTITLWFNDYFFKILISRNYTKSEDSIESNFFSASTSFFQVYQVKNFFKVVALGNLSCNAELTFYCIIYLGLSFLDLLLCKVLCMITLLVPYLKSRSWTRTIQGVQKTFEWTKRGNFMLGHPVYCIVFLFLLFSFQVCFEDRHFFRRWAKSWRKGTLVFKFHIRCDLNFHHRIFIRHIFRRWRILRFAHRWQWIRKSYTDQWQYQSNQ